MTTSVFSGTVSIERTSKPVLMFLSDSASEPVLEKKSGSPVAMTLPTLPVPRGNFIARSFSEVSRNFFSLAGSFPQSVGE